MSLRTVGKALKQAAWAFLSDNAFTLAAALAFYAMLSAAPLLVLLTTALGFLSEPVQQRILGQVSSLIGPDASQGVALLMEHARVQHLDATISAIAGLVGILLTATAVFAQLQYSLNLIFNVRTKRGYVAGWFAEWDPEAAQARGTSSSRGSAAETADRRAANHCHS